MMRILKLGHIQGVFIFYEFHSRNQGRRPMTNKNKVKEINKKSQEEKLKRIERECIS